MFPPAHLTEAGKSSEGSNKTLLACSMFGLLTKGEKQDLGRLGKGPSQ